jgi:flagellar hook-basal body complex protein FliE
MNNTRREATRNVKNQVDMLLTELENLLGEETEAYENMPEGLQGGDAGCASEEAQSNLETAVSALEEAISALEEIAG